MRTINSNRFNLLTLITLLILTQTASALMLPIVPRSILKSKFERGDVPTQSQFGVFIDSFATQTPDGLTITGIGIDLNSVSQPAARMFAGESVGSGLSFASIGGTSSTIPLLEPQFGGESGYLALRLADSSNTYYGYFQVSMQSPLTFDPPAIDIQYFAFESTPNASIPIVSLPEPASAIFLMIGTGLIVLRRRKYQ